MAVFDVIVIGGGIGGVSVAARLATHARVLLLEREGSLAWHTTGRSAAVFTETYGAAPVRELTTASRAFLTRPPAGFFDGTLLRPRASLYFAEAKDAGVLATLIAENPQHMRAISAANVAARVPILRTDLFSVFAEEPGSADIDVHALFEGFRRLALRGGVEILSSADVTAMSYKGGVWNVVADGREFSAGVVVNAAGAWAGEVGVLAGAVDLGLRPLRRTVIVIPPPPASVDWPLVNDVAADFYFKCDSAGILISPGDETPSAPCDAQPDEYDVAVAAARFEEVTTLPVTRIQQRWAGLRVFAPSRVPASEFDAELPGFFWHAGLGGYGIQTAPALSERAAATIVARL